MLLVDIGTIMNYISPLSNDDDLRINLRLRTLDLGVQKEDFALPTLDILTLDFGHSIITQQTQ